MGDERGKNQTKTEKNTDAAQEESLGKGGKVGLSELGGGRRGLGPKHLGREDWPARAVVVFLHEHNEARTEIRYSVAKKTNDLETGTSCSCPGEELWLK